MDLMDLMAGGDWVESRRMAHQVRLVVQRRERPRDPEMVQTTARTPKPPLPDTD